MPDVEASVMSHYNMVGLQERILNALAATGIDTSRLNAEDLEPVDEFHIGAADATTELLDRLALKPETKLLEIGSGIGGPARLAARRTGVNVTGIDLAERLVAIATRFSEMTRLSDKTRFIQGSALAMPFDEASFDAAMMLHVGMNIADKPQLMREAARVLRPGAAFAVYDVMRLVPGDLAFPLPWAETDDTSFVETPADYEAAASAAGFSTRSKRELGATAVRFFSKIRQRAAEAEAAGRPPPLGPAIVMENARPKLANLMAAVEGGILAPVEIILQRD